MNRQHNQHIFEYNLHRAHLPSFYDEYGPAITVPINAIMYEIFHKNPEASMSYYSEAVQKELSLYRETINRYTKQTIKRQINRWLWVRNDQQYNIVPRSLP